MLWLALLVGAFSAINTWDVPTYGLLALGTLAVVVFVADRHAIAPRTLGKYLIVATAFWAVGYLLFLPFHAGYESVFAGVFQSRWQTVAWLYMAIHGLPFFIVGSWLTVEAYRRLPAVRSSVAGLRRALLEDRSAAFGGGRILTVVLAVIALGMAITVWVRFPALHQWTTVLVLMLVAGVALALALTWLERFSAPAAPVQLLLLGMLVIALGIGIGVDFVTAERDIDRMNTVFKFYLNAWVLWGTIAGVALWQLYATGALRWAGRFRYAKVPWFALLVLLVMSTAIFPVLGTQARIADRFSTDVGLTLDGTLYQEYAVYGDPGPSNQGIEDDGRYPLAADRDALRYIQRHVEGTAVFLEGVSDQYRWTPRVAVYTGNPVVVGWEWHQVQQRGAGGVEPLAVRDRISDVRRMYTTTSIDELRAGLEEYGVDFVYVGPTERLYFPEAGLAKFEEAIGSLLEVFYSNGEVTVYRVLV
jgi:YYY domain-containing protein